MDERLTKTATAMDTDDKHPDDEDEGGNFITDLGLSKDRSTKDGAYIPKPKGEDKSPDKYFHYSNDCDKDVAMCFMCMNKINGIKSRLINSLLRLSNLEESKAGSIESAIMVKSEVFRGRRDIFA